MRFRMRTGLRQVTRWAVPLVLLAVGAPMASAQRAHIGPRIGANFDSDDVLIGGQALLPLSRRVEFYPSMDIYFPNTGTSLGFNADLKVRFPTPDLDFYAGGGLNYLYRKVAGNSNGDVGANLLGGIETQAGWVHPFVEGRVLLHDNTSFQLVGGLNFTIGRH
jgi:hypothetical protein